MMVIGKRERTLRTIEAFHQESQVLSAEFPTVGVPAYFRLLRLLPTGDGESTGFLPSSSNP